MDIVAKAQIDIAAPATEVWRALTDPESIAKYFFGSQVETDWQPGSPITWKGQYNGKSFEDKGEILEVAPNRLLQMSHFSPLSGQPDKPENYHTLTYELTEADGSTHLSLSQNNNSSKDEAEHSTTNWETMLEALKKTVEDR
jgi:uncharacterized protein YndB with AHSA1/START domain